MPSLPTPLTNWKWAGYDPCMTDAESKLRHLLLTIEQHACQGCGTVRCLFCEGSGCTTAEGEPILHASGCRAARVMGWRRESIQDRRRAMKVQRQITHVRLFGLVGGRYVESDT